MERVTDRSNRRTAPEAVHPFGRYQSIVEAVQDFNAVRDETLRFASEEGVNLLSRSARYRVEEQFREPSSGCSDPSRSPSAPLPLSRHALPVFLPLIL